MRIAFSPTDASVAETELRNRPISASTRRWRVSRCACSARAASSSRARSIALSRNTATARAMPPISSLRSPPLIATPVSPPASVSVVPTSVPSGLVIERAAP
jgi:hypothetical protein